MRPGDAMKFAPSDNEGAGNAGCRVHPQPCLQQRNNAQASHTGTPQQSGIPCAMVLRLIRDLPGVPGLLATVLGGLSSANLMPASGHQDHATSPNAWTALVSRGSHVHRTPPHVS